MMDELKFSEVSFSPESIQEVYPEVTSEQAFDLLYKIQEELTEAMLWVGWMLVAAHLEVKDDGVQVESFNDPKRFDSGFRSESDAISAMLSELG